MMPIFFHANAHLWIVLALFANGFTVHLLCQSVSKQYRSLVAPLEAQVIMSFVFSLAINGLTLLALDLAGLAFSNAIYVLLAVAGTSLTIAVWRGVFSAWNMDVNYAGLILYAAMFIVLFYNGGMIDQISDAWWHMSLANKIGWANSFSLEYGHLTGMPERYYPPLWHANLALLRELSGQSLPSIWNAFTAWGGVLKLMAFYLLGLALFGDRKIAFLGAFFFALLPGIGNSYMRVSAWPSHQAYTLFYFSLFVLFRVVDEYQHSSNCLFDEIKLTLNKWPMLLVLFLTLLLVFFLHQFEVLIFCIAVFLYLLGLSQYRFFKSASEGAMPDASVSLFRLLYRIGLGLLIAISIYFLTGNRVGLGHLDGWVVVLLPVFLCTLLLMIDLGWFAKKRIGYLIFTAFVLAILMSLSYQHLVSLFVPELALPSSGTGERPLLATGWFGNKLTVPGWHLQLRSGLLWSGLLGMILSVAICVCRPSRGAIFLASNCCFVWIVCLSPYLYQWLTSGLAYHSVWRVATLSFHPLVIAVVCVWLWKELGRNVSQYTLRT